MEDVDSDILNSRQWFKAVEQISTSRPEDLHRIASSQMKIINRYYEEVLSQAKTSFKWALIAAGIGLVFFVASIALIILEGFQDAAIIGTIGGTLVEFISGINFYLYGQTSSQLDYFHKRLDNTQRYLLANSMCESLDDKVKDKTRSELIKEISKQSGELQN